MVFGIVIGASLIVYGASLSLPKTTTTTPAKPSHNQFGQSSSSSSLFARRRPVSSFDPHSHDEHHDHQQGPNPGRGTVRLEQMSSASVDRYYDKNHNTNLLQKYMRAAEERPLLTKGLTAAVVNALGDLLAQYIESSSSLHSIMDVDWLRVQGFFFCGLLYVGPFIHWWYEQLEKFASWLHKKYDSSKRTQSLAQVVMDQTVGVVLSTPLYFYAHEILDALVRHRGKSFWFCVGSVVFFLGTLFMWRFLTFTFQPSPLL